MSKMYLLDTNVWLWMVDNPSLIPARMKIIVSDGANYPFSLSAISIWEVAKKVSLGKLGISLPVHEWVDRATDTSYIHIVPLSPQISVESTRLPGDFHKDPADQIIVATARCQNLTILTADRLIRQYDFVQTI